MLDNLVGDVYRLFDEGHESSDKNLDSLANSIREVVHDRLRDAAVERSGGLRLSAIGVPCDRKVWYKDKGYPYLPLRPETKIKFLFGDIIEALLIFLIKEAGYEVEGEQQEVEIGGVLGHMDCVINGVVADIKSASSYSFKKFKDGTLDTDDPFGYNHQLSAYKNATGIKQGVFVAMDKQHGHLAVHEPMFTENTEQRIAHLKEVLEMDTPPDRGFDDEPDGKSGNRKLCTNCSYCDYKFECWPGLRTFLYSNGPRYLTNVGKLPNVVEV